MGNIIWLASYPKSGNTWLRTFLSNYLSNSERPVPINQLNFGWLTTIRERFDEDVGISSADMTPREIDLYRPAFHDYLSAQLEKPSFVKVHDAYTHNARGQPLFPGSATAGVIYLVRNPRDVVISYAHHSNWSISRTIREMNCKSAMLSYSDNGLMSIIHQRLLSWSQHVRSWTQQTNLPLHVVRYEDMVRSPTKTFTEIVKFAQLSFSAERLRQALSFSQFDRLEAQERVSGFREKASQSRSFFRNGKVSAWREVLTAAEVELITRHHGEMMKCFNYGETGYDRDNKSRDNNRDSYSALGDCLVQRA